MPSGATAPAGGITPEVPSTNTAPMVREDIEPQVSEPPAGKKPKGSGQVKNNPTTPSAGQGRGETGNYSVVAAAGDFDNN